MPVLVRVNVGFSTLSIEKFVPPKEATDADLTLINHFVIKVFCASPFLALLVSIKVRTHLAQLSYLLYLNPAFGLGYTHTLCTAVSLQSLPVLFTTCLISYLITASELFTGKVITGLGDGLLLKTGVGAPTVEELHDQNDLCSTLLVVSVICTSPPQIESAAYINPAFGLRLINMDSELVSLQPSVVVMIKVTLYPESL